MFSVRLRHRADPMTSAPRPIAYSAMWLRTNPVIPVMSNRMAGMLHELDVTTRQFCRKTSTRASARRGRPS